jgi:type II secretory pathway component PulF
MAEGARQVVQDLGEGVPLSEIMRRRTMVPEVIAWMTGLGERRGNLGMTLHQVADMYRRQVEMRAALLRSVMPPILILFTAGVMVGLFVLAVFLPMFQLLRGLGGL